MFRVFCRGLVKQIGCARKGVIVREEDISAVKITLRPKRNRIAGFALFVRNKPLGALGLFILLAVAFMAITADIISVYDPAEILQGQKEVAPNGQFWFGTDHLARDMWSRITHGARISLTVGVLVVLFGTSIGTLFGVISAYMGGTFDILTQRVVDVFMSIPTLILALAIMAMLGQSLGNLVLALVISVIPGTTRTMRSVALGVGANQYVEGAVAIGATGSRIVLQHMLVNCLPAAFIIASSVLGGAILAEASLSFLGLGVPPEIPTWGNMLSGQVTQRGMTSPWIAIFPGLALTITVFAINVLGDALRDVLDPRLRGA